MCEKRCVDCKLFTNREEIPDTVSVKRKPKLFGLIPGGGIEIKRTGKMVTTGFMDCSAGSKTGLVDGDQNCLVEDEFQPIDN